MVSRSLTVSTLFVALGCGSVAAPADTDVSDDGSSDTGTQTPETRGGEEDGSSESGGTTSGSGAESESSSSTGTGTGAICGDGVVDSEEGCDDGNLQDGDGCSATCATEAFAPWVWLEPRQGSVNGLYLDDKSTVTVVGGWGDRSGSGDDDALVRQFALNGTVVFEDDPSVGKDSTFNAVDLGPDGMFYAFGGTNSGYNGWVHSFGDGLGVDRIDDLLLPYEEAEFGPNGYAAFVPRATLVHQPFVGPASVLQEAWYRSMTYEEAGTIASVFNEEDSGHHPVSLVRLDDTWKVLKSVAIKGEFSTEDFTMATTSDGGILVSGIPGVNQRTVLRFDADLEYRWSATIENVWLNTVSEHGGQVLLGGTRAAEQAPYIAVLSDADGVLQWETELDMSAHDYAGGVVRAASMDASGRVAVGGTAYTGSEGALENGHAFVNYFDPDDQ